MADGGPCPPGGGAFADGDETGSAGGAGFFGAELIGEELAGEGLGVGLERAGDALPGDLGDEVVYALFVAPKVCNPGF